LIGVNLARSYLFTPGTMPHQIERAPYAGPRVRIHLGQVDLSADLGAEPGPDELELLWATQVLDVVATAAATGKGVAVDADGRLIDEAVAESARRILELSRKSPATEAEGGVVKNDAA
jgi:hypothetical protein